MDDRMIAVSSSTCEDKVRRDGGRQKEIMSRSRRLRLSHRFPRTNVNIENILVQPANLALRVSISAELIFGRMQWLCPRLSSNMIEASSVQC